VSNSFESGRQVGNMIGVALAPIMLVGFGFFMSRSLSKKRVDGKKVQWPIIAGALLSLLMIAGYVMGPKQSGALRSVEAAR
jgi:uncharacterized membrane protein